MAALTANRPIARAGDPNGVVLPILSRPMAGSTTLFAGAMVALNASGFLVDGITSTTQVAYAVNRRFVTNPGANGAVFAEVLLGAFPMLSAGSGDQLGPTTINKDVFCVDDQTVGATNGGSTRSRCGYHAWTDPATGLFYIMFGLATPG